jgi:hypothetical protein
LKKGIVHVLRAQSTHIHPGVKPIVQRKRAALAAYKRACAEEYSASTTHYCLLRGAIWGADFIQTENGLRGKLALLNGGRHLASAGVKSSFAEEAPLS